MSVPLIDRDSYGAALALRDLTEPGRGPHAMQRLLREAVEALRASWRCDVIVHRGHPVVSVADNYERLLYPPDAVTRDARYTRYVTPSSVLRTHATGMIPGLLRSLATAAPSDVLLVCPGLVYRRDRIDRHSVGEPHQLDLWRIRRGPLDEADLQRMIEMVLAAVLPGIEWRALPTHHPYTTAGREMEARRDERWVEVGECGLAAPAILAGAGLAPDVYSGLAMGLGLDRLLMLRKGIDDIRLLRSADPRVASQMLDLSPYRPVSSMPPVRRDLSIAVAGETTAEELGDRVRSALGSDVEAVEAVEVVSETERDDLPPAAAARLGIQAGQKNVLLRVVLRHPTRTLGSKEANRLRDRVYASVHEGTIHHWIEKM
jgi:phenylalanyl-tRNA synthetase alpha chain